MILSEFRYIISADRGNVMTVRKTASVKNTVKRMTILLLLLVSLLFSLASCNGDSNYLNRFENTDKFQIVFSDVGQADGAFVVAPNGNAVVIDCGDFSSSEKFLSDLYVHGVKKIEKMIITHPHDDHLGGVFGLLSAFEPEKIIMPECEIEGLAGEKFGDVTENIEIEYAVCGKSWLFEGCRLSVLSPDKVENGGDNNDSIVILFEIGGVRVLFTGDAETETEEKLLSRYGAKLKADILKVGHHGSKTSSSEDFIKTVSPEYAVISVGEGNSFGLPSSDVTARLEEKNIKIFRTDYNGSITVVTDGKDFEFVTEK